MVPMENQQSEIIALLLERLYENHVITKEDYEEALQKKEYQYGPAF